MSECCYWVTPTESDEPLMVRVDVSGGEPSDDKLQELADLLFSFIARSQGDGP